MTSRQRIQRKNPWQPQPAPDFFKTRGFANGIKARESRLPETNILQTRPFATPAQDLSTQEDTRTPEQKEAAASFGYNAASISVVAPSTPSVQREEDVSESEEKTEIQTKLTEGEAGEKNQPEAEGGKGESYGFNWANIPAVAPSTSSVQREEDVSEREEKTPVQTKLTVGEAGYKYEQEADRVAAEVVQRINAPTPEQSTQGQSVQRQEVAEESGDNYEHNAELADTQETHHPISSSGDSLQRKMSFSSETEYLDSDKNQIELQSYVDTQKAAKENNTGTISVQEGKPKVGTAAYTPDNLEWGGQITVQALNKTDKETKSKEYQSRLIAVAHETRHGVDDLEKNFNFRGKKAEQIRTEWRAFATQSAVAWEILQKSGKDKVEERYLSDLAAFANKEVFVRENGRMFETTQSYMRLYGLPHENQDVKDFMILHDDWVNEALKLHQDLRPAVVPAKPWYKDYGIIIVSGVVVTAASVAIGLAQFYGYL